MGQSDYGRAGLALVMGIGLAGCGGSTEGQGSPRASLFGAAPVQRDIENPDAFSRRETGLWDGRPSLGGVWVAHPDVTMPERVLIRNVENGQETIGALFRRERLNPGPTFQVSNEAANAVGMLAGAPTMLEVIALRLEDVTPPAGPAPEEGAVPAPPGTQAAAPAGAPARNGGFLRGMFGRNRAAAEAAAPVGATPEAPIPAPARDSATRAGTHPGHWQIGAPVAARPDPAVH
ncbi:MAG: SPOR domain-containing protein [Roseinatronobacter sp.]